MKSKNAQRRYTHGDKSYWSELLWGQAQSGQRVKEYCRAQGVSASSFYRWQKLLEGDIESGGGFSAIEIQSSPSLGVVVELPGGIVVRFGDCPPVGYLHRLIECFQKGVGC